MTEQRRTKGIRPGLCLLAVLLCFPGPLRAEEQNGILATVAGRNITEADIADKIEAQLVRINTQIYAVKKQAVDALITDYLLEQEAKKRGLSREQLLQQEVNAQRFRSDLYFRIAVLVVTLPPLRERMHDLVFLVDCNKLFYQMVLDL